MAPSETPLVAGQFVRCRVFSTGYCVASEHHVIQGGRQVKMHCQALVALLEHPTHGYLLFDTGYAHARLLAATARLPYRFYRHAAPFVTSSEAAAVAVLPRRFGIDVSQIKTVILSHFHPDHLSGLGDFPNARIIATADGFAAASSVKGISALAHGILPDLLPTDFADRADLLPAIFTGESLPYLGPTHDVFGDGLLRIVRLPGHAVGQIGLLAATERGPVFFVADAAYTRRSIRGKPSAASYYQSVYGRRAYRGGNARQTAPIFPGAVRCLPDTHSLPGSVSRMGPNRWVRQKRTF